MKKALKFFGDVALTAFPTCLLIVWGCCLVSHSPIPWLELFAIGYVATTLWMLGNENPLLNIIGLILVIVLFMEVFYG